MRMPLDLGDTGVWAGEDWTPRDRHLCSEHSSEACDEGRMGECPARVCRGAAPCGLAWTSRLLCRITNKLKDLCTLSWHVEHGLHAKLTAEQTMV